MPKRIQRKRTKGWKMPPNTVYVGRPTKWGNPIRGMKGFEYPPRLVELYQDWLTDPDNELAPTAEEIRAALKGKNLACWCELSSCCHADVLLELANS